MSNVVNFPVKEWLGYESAEALLEAALEKSTYLSDLESAFRVVWSLEINKGQYPEVSFGKYIVKAERPDGELAGLFGLLPHNLYLIPRKAWGTELHEKYSKMS